MTTRDDARREATERRADAVGPGRPRVASAQSRTARPTPADSGRPDQTGLGESAPSLPERLYAARERKGVDLYRAERDTKIRARYLGALERGDYRELPGAVYTKGFLRNYALYLGLEPDEILGQWRRERGESSSPPTPLIAVPRPIAPPRRGLTFSPSVIVAALLTVAVLGVGVYLAVQVLRFAKPPVLAVSDPAVATLEVEEDRTSYVLRGTSIPGATITVEVAGGSRRTSADSTGAWFVKVDLRRGKNQFKIDATDPDTGKHAEETAQIVITVPSLAIEAPTLSVDQPADGTTFENGAIPVQGKATNATGVSVSAVFEGPLEGAPASTGASVPPAPASITAPVAEDGTFSTPVQLTTGRWSITVTAADARGKTASLTRRVTVAYSGVNLVVTATGGRAWIKVWVDGKLDPSIGGVGRTIGDGKTMTFTAKESVEVLTGSSGATFFTLNGQPLGALGKRGVVETWLFKPPDPPAQTERR